MAAAAAAIPDPDFVIITGDYTRHSADEFGSESGRIAVEAIHAMVDLTEKYFAARGYFTCHKSASDLFLEIMISTGTTGSHRQASTPM